MEKMNECGCGCGCSEEKNECGCSGHEHDNECGCGCEDEEKTIDLELEDGTSLKCLVLGVFGLENFPENEYIALLPEGHEDVFLYGFAEGQDGVELSNIEDDEEFEAVSNRFMEIFEEEDEEYEEE